MKKDMEINGGKWYIRCDGCDGWWKKMVLTVFQVWCGVICAFFKSRGVRWIMYMDRCMREDVCFSCLHLDRISDFFI